MPNPPRYAGGDIAAPRIHVFDTALEDVADVVNGAADVTAVTAVSAAREIEAGRSRVIGISAPERLAPPFDASPTWREQGVDCVIGAWRGVTAPTGTSPAAVAFWQTLLTAATSHPSWQTDLAAHSWSPMYLNGSELQAYLAEEASGLTAILRELGLLRAPKA